VEGEFEVDLTIADEDFEKQFWFIDFRFLFSPAPQELSDALRSFLEVKVNDTLAVDGLAGCYQFLHEFVLTHKITEFTRQAVELSRGRWIESLRVERLNRAMSIQYWVNRPTPGLKSWIILGVHSASKTEEPQHAKSQSHLYIRWFRDNKEVKDVDITVGSGEVSGESLLKTVIARHVEYILSSIHKKLLSYPRFSKREASLSLKVSRIDPMRSELIMRLSQSENLVARIDPITGSFSLSPPFRMVLQGERKLNFGPKDPVDDGFSILERSRCAFAGEELTRRGKSLGWTMQSPPVKLDELKPLANTRDQFQLVWLQRQGWKPEWFVLVTMSLSGDRWWLIEV
jgi:mediator of RNA polymerase II transcription subunit 14